MDEGGRVYRREVLNKEETKSVTGYFGNNSRLLEALSGIFIGIIRDALRYVHIVEKCHAHGCRACTKLQARAQENIQRREAAGRGYRRALLIEKLQWAGVTGYFEVHYPRRVASTCNCREASSPWRRGLHVIPRER